MVSELSAWKRRDTMTPPLSKLKILDLTQVMAGPFCCQLLADMGADVTKVEPPKTGDQTRHALGFTMKGEDTAAFIAVNRNKKSITLNLKKEEGREIFYKLAQNSDVLVENYRPGVAKRLGADYETLKEISPRLIHASISGFGQTGPYADRAGYDLIAQGMSGVMSVTGEPDGPPAKCGVPIADLSAGLFCAFGILCAYVAREETGRGQYIDTSLFEGALAFSIWEMVELWATGRVPQPLGSAHRLNAPYQALKTRDGYLNVGPNNQRLWTRFCKALGREELTEDKRFSTNEDRMVHREELVEELESVLKERDTDEWEKLLLEEGVPVGSIYNYKQVFENPHTRVREMVVEMEHPVEGTVWGLGIPVKLSETPGEIRCPAPLLGQHTEETLAGLGYSKAEIADLRERKVI
jgi:crotonobetainyl-CoA:carnitine CoA-transferase CaiB-like acyl-CoA transferase